LAIVAGLLGSILKGIQEADFLRQLIGATVQILGFTGIIIGIIYPRLGTSTKDIQQNLREWTEAYQKSPPEFASTYIQPILTSNVDRLDKLQTTFISTLSKLHYGAIAFAAALVTELFHFKMYDGTVSQLWSCSNQIAFGIELGLLFFGIEMLLLGLMGTFRLAF
jgi:hypothetical protein